MQLRSVVVEEWLIVCDRVPKILSRLAVCVFGALLAMFGTVFARWITGTSINAVSFLGAIIGVGIVAKNGILMLDRVESLCAEGLPLEEALVQSGRRGSGPCS